MYNKYNFSLIDLYLQEIFVSEPNIYYNNCIHYKYYYVLYNLNIFMPIDYKLLKWKII